MNNGKIISNQQVGPDIYLMRLKPVENNFMTAAGLVRQVKAGKIEQIKEGKTEKTDRVKTEPTGPEHLHAGRFENIQSVQFLQRKFEKSQLGRTGSLKLEQFKNINPGQYSIEKLGQTKLEKFWQVKPGQFIHLKLGNDNLSLDPLLRRPFSIHDYKEDTGIISIVYRVVGRGTRIMSKLQAGQLIDFLGPLGSGFSLEFRNQEIHVLGGGIGLAPLYFLASTLCRENRVRVYLGGNGADDIKYFYDKFADLNIYLATATLDGSRGYRGNVLALWERELEDPGKLNSNQGKPNFIFSCGPEPMLVRLQELARKLQVSGEVSLEERMGCGIGVCLSCVCKTKAGNQRICREGPVFELGEVVLGG